MFQEDLLRRSRDMEEKWKSWLTPDEFNGVMKNEAEWNKSKCKKCKNITEKRINPEDILILKCSYYLGWQSPKDVCGGFKD